MDGEFTGVAAAAAMAGRVQSQAHTVAVSTKRVRVRDLAASATGDEGGVAASLAFLQLQQLAWEPGAATVRLESSEALSRALSVLDRTLTVAAHKVGVLYVGEGQTTQAEILSNAQGSPRYQQLLRALGRFVTLSELGPELYSGGLDRSPDALDGRFSLFWASEALHVMYHVATLMPTRPGDAAGTHKKRHIGNDYVHIVYNDSGALAYDPDTLTGQFTFVAIVVAPLDADLYRVTVHRKPQILPFGPLLAAQLVPAAHLGALVRQTSVNADIACHKYQEERGQPFRSHAEERLAQLKLIAERFASHAAASASSTTGTADGATLAPL